SLLGAVALAMAETETSKASVADFDARVTRDISEVRSANPALAGFADVVQKIMPSVVSISTYSKKAAHGGFGGGPSEEELNSIPPWFRQWFEEQQQQGQAPGQRKRQAPQQPRKPVQTGLGSGVLLTDNGYIMTNNHVVDGADQLKVIVGDKAGKEYDAKVIGTDPQSDIALIKIEGTNFPHATIGDSSKLRVGDIVLALGSPMGLDQSVTHGIVSALGRSNMGIIGNAKQAGFENFIQTDAAINPGNSGGPLVDSQGRVIGINAAIETRSGMFSGIGLAIPINMALNNVHDLLAGGKVERGFLGIQMGEVDPSMVDLLDLKDENGVTVSRMVPDSPAQKAGFEEGDVIISAQGQKVQDLSKLRLMISSQRPGTDVKFGVVRMNEKTRKPERKELIAKLDKLPDNPSLTSVKPKPSAPKSAASSFIEGVRVENITDDLRQNYNIEKEVQGVVVTNVDEKSQAFKVGLEEGDVITQVNRKPVTTLSDASENKGQPGEIVQLKIIRSGQTKFLAVKN
ncbi:MAG: Do family serine endopeptidase, partial [Verrucomicrobia bacterium]|nr:Do family serine endopeptidase [Verrucomicrobiota bacterium]